MNIFDKRYTVTREYTGHKSGKPRYVLRFNLDFIDSRATESAAINLLEKHSRKRLAGLTAKPI
jgi:hypothetical protein